MVIFMKISCTVSGSDLRSPVYKSLYIIENLLKSCHPVESAATLQIMKEDQL